MESTKNSTTPDVEDWDVSFGIPINELKEILNAAELAEEFADDAPKWDDATSETRDTEMMPSTKLQSKLEEKKAIKWYAVVQATLTRTTQENDVEYITLHFRSNCFVELMENTIAEHLESAFKKIQNLFEEFTQRGSGWILDKILKLELNIAKYQSLSPSSYIPLPKKLANKKAILNIKNEDQKCFVWCLLAHKLKIDRNYNANSIHHYIPYESEIKLGNVKCPVPLTSISTLEKLNNVRINVFGFEDEILPLYVSSREDLDCINLLYISNEERQHYCLIRNFSRLIGDLSKHQGKNSYMLPMFTPILSGRLVTRASKLL
ncbi:uncharacterized protein TNCV_4448421 [Trichonephila clavipes]|nr:uncharacterized protein TNCV_4448421 [Trichonephila clavipes]